LIISQFAYAWIYTSYHSHNVCSGRHIYRLEIRSSNVSWQTSIRHVAPSPSQAIDFARPCITWGESKKLCQILCSPKVGKQYRQREEHLRLEGNQHSQHRIVTKDCPLEITTPFTRLAILFKKTKERKKRNLLPVVVKTKSFIYLAGKY